VIELTRLDGSAVVVNADVIAWLESTPDTVVSLLNGEKLLVRETPRELIDRAVAYRQRLNIAHGFREADVAQGFSPAEPGSFGQTDVAQGFSPAKSDSE
jgi:flagellar protein FlbD